jgi:hypothetical protein
MLKKCVLLLYYVFLPFCLFADYDNFGIEVGKKYYILQYRANVREEPNRNSNVIAILSLNNQIEIIEYTGIVEEINGIRNSWYKIKYGNIVGYTFGGNIAVDSLVTDIAKNGVKDYFHVRASNELGYSTTIDTRTDVVIYVNNRRINTNILREEGSDGRYNRHYQFVWCVFEDIGDYVFIGLISYGRHESTYVTGYKIDGDGNIEYFNSGSLDPWD